MNLSRERIDSIRGKAQHEALLAPGEVADLIGHNDHLTNLCEARARLLISAEAEIDRLKSENEALRSAALAAGEFIMHEAEVRGLLDDRGQVSHRHPRRQQTIARIQAAMVKEASHD
jgi:hypothetical protein